MAKTKKQKLVEKFRQATQDFKKEYQSLGEWHSYAAPIPFGKFTIDEDFGKKEICIRCRKVWTDQLIQVAQQVCRELRCKYTSPLSVGGFGTAYNFFTIRIP